MSGQDSGILTNVAVSKSGQVDNLLIEKFINKVHKKYISYESLYRFFDIQNVVDTNKVSNKYLGETVIKKLIPGKDTPADPVEADKNALVIDTTVIARNTIDLLHDVQNDINSLKSDLADDHGKNMRKLEDKMLVQQLIHGVLSNTEAVRTTPRVAGHGFSTKIEISDAQALLPNVVMAGIEQLTETMQVADYETEDIAFLVTWPTFYVLRDAERIANVDYMTGTGTEVKGSKAFVIKTTSTPIVPSNRFPTEANTSSNRHLLSNADNAYRYDVSAAQIACIAVGFTRKALLVGRSIQLTGDIFFDKRDKTFYIDSWMAEGAIPDRWDAVCGLFKGGSTNTALATRADRKVVYTKAVT